MPWYLYLLECKDKSIYTGIAVDVQKRFAAHLAGKGARYTRSHPPKKILASVKYKNRSLASKAEHAVKQLTAKEKRALIKGLQRVAPVASAPPLPNNPHLENHTRRGRKVRSAPRGLAPRPIY